MQQAKGSADDEAEPTFESAAQRVVYHLCALGRKGAVPIAVLGWLRVLTTVFCVEVTINPTDTLVRTTVLKLVAALVASQEATLPGWANYYVSRVAETLYRYNLSERTRTLGLRLA